GVCLPALSARQGHLPQRHAGGSGAWLRGKDRHPRRNLAVRDAPRRRPGGVRQSPARDLLTASSHGNGWMRRLPDNVVLSAIAAAALCREFVGWQCRIRQLAARQEGGRPSPGMRPRVLNRNEEELSAGIVTLIVESEPAHSTQLFRYQYLRTHDPVELYDSML